MKNLAKRLYNCVALDQLNVILHERNTNHYISITYTPSETSCKQDLEILG